MKNNGATQIRKNNIQKLIIISIILILILLLIPSCIPLENIITKYVNETRSAWTVLPTYSPYPTYTIQPSFQKEITRIVVVSKTLVPTPTKTKWRPTTVWYTSVPTVDLTGIPHDIIDRASVAGLEPNEVVYIFNLLQKAAVDRDPNLLLDFLRFPLHQSGKCPGDVIETPEEYVKRFPFLMSETTRKNIIKMKIEDTFLSWRGMGLKANYPYDIWIIPYCGDTECKTTFIVLEKFLEYSIFWELVNGNPNSTPC